MTRPSLLADLLGPNAVVAGLDAADKKQVIFSLSRHASGVLGVEEHILSDILWEREKLGTTGVGHGIAIPHGRIPGLTQVHGFFARLLQPVPFDAADNVPVDIVFLLLAPEDAGADHLHALASVSRALRDTGLCEQLRKAKDGTTLTKLLNKASPSEAA